MSFDLPATVEQDILRYARAEHISADEAVLQIVEVGLRAVRQRSTRPVAGRTKKAAKHEITEADLETLRQNLPIFAFLEQLPDSVIDGMEAASKQIRAERCSPRG